MNTEISPLTFFRTAIRTNATAAREHRATARQQVLAGRKLRAGGDDTGADVAYGAAVKARRAAAGLGDETRYLLLAYAFLRRRSYAALEGTRKRAAAPAAELVLAMLAEAGVPTTEAAISAWLRLEPAAAPTHTEAHEFPCIACAS